jgi:polyphenol oxidase
MAMTLPTPFYEHDGQIAIDFAHARAVFTTASWGDVRDTWRVVADRLGVRVVRVKQVHGSEVIALGEGRERVDGGSQAEADGVASALRGVAPMVLAADCLPIVIVGGGAVAAVHAGWRGLDSGVIGNAVQELRSGAAGVQLSCAIGPGAGACCYEVGPELHARFPGFSVGRNLDLKAIARAQLVQAGVGEIHDCGVCTICSEPGTLFSYRRDGASTGRQAAITWLN